jgi:uncharacterized UBP type Zn finger protein
MSNPGLTLHEECFNSVNTESSIRVATCSQDTDKKHFISEILVKEGKRLFKFYKTNADLESTSETFKIPPWSKYPNFYMTNLSIIVI